ncbi:triphosphoribosyl-dephospho-CoA synthase [Rubrobacter calidifluminis]|uniref:triphosphoribosyl-dephospho-CoA synthase n=1 Tax=Rubrobacter calidifluminis TaxID=1392640 RepID=UPI002361A5AD|nr:triphosphoribosyl-dephospho-CoA synthase [Rubrobacter calidifluminis]
MAQREDVSRVPEGAVAAGAMVALTLVYSAPMPGVGSRYTDAGVAHESRMLSAPAVGQAVAGAGARGVGQTVLEAVLASRRVAGYADPRAGGFLAPLARAALRAEPLRSVLRGLGREDLLAFARALSVSGSGGALAGAVQISLEAGEETTLREVVRFAADRDPLAREYARNFEVSGQLARNILLSALSRADSARAALVHTYLEVLSEVPDLDVAARANRREAEEVSRMARGVQKSGGVYSRRGLQAVNNLDGALRADSRLAPTATESLVAAAAFMVSLEHGPEALSYRLQPAGQR